MMKIFAGVTVSRVSYSIMLICALEFMFWFAPVLSTSSAVSVTQMERAGALAYYQAAAQFGATDAPMVAHAQRELLAVNAAEAQRSVLASARDEWAAGAAANSGGALNGAAAMLGSLVLTGGALLLGGGGGGVGGGGGGGRGGRRIAQCADGSGADANNNNNNGKKKKKQQQPAAATSGDDGMAAASMGGALPLVAAATVGAAAALAMRTGSAGGAGGVARRFASKASGASRAPAAAMDAQVRSQQQQQQQQQQPASKQQASKQQAAMPFEVVPPHALKADCGQAVEAPPAALSSDELCAKSDAELVALIDAGTLAPHTLETALGDLERAVRVRRAAVAGAAGASLDALPFEHYDYSKVVGACAENVLGYVPIPVGVAGPVLMDGRRVALPMATTEGCLIASTHRGCKAISESGGATTVLTNDGMTRAPAVQLPSAARAGALMAWLGDAGNEQLLRDAFESTTRFGKLLDVRATMAGRLVYVRFRAQTGDAMGMNMISKGVEAAMAALTAAFPDADCVALSGNMCTDKKPSAINWVNGRGKSVVAEAVVRADVVRRTLKSDVDALVALNVSKNLVGSAMAGSVGGFNAHASNIVTALYLATGQDPAQNVESSNCITLMERTDDGDLRISVTMPSIECAAIGGGTHLPAQHAALELMGCAGAHADTPGANAQQFARAVAVGTLAGELSLMSALCAGHLVRAHMAHNRKK